MRFDKEISKCIRNEVNNLGDDIYIDLEDESGIITVISGKYTIKVKIDRKNKSNKNINDNIDYNSDII